MEAAMAQTTMALGMRIRYLRGRIGLSQDALAERSGISSKYLGEVERGQANISVQVLERVAGALGVMLPDMFEGAHELSRGAILLRIQKILDDADEERLRAAYRVLKDVLL